MIIRNTTPEDLSSVMKIYEYARTFMCEHGNPNQWPSTYPQEDFILEEIGLGHSFVCLDDNVTMEIVGSFCFIIGDDPTYSLLVDGFWLNDKRYGTIHRIASSGKVKGVGDACIKWCFTQIDNIRIDTHQDNIVMQNLLAKQGFSRCGIIYTDNGSPRIAYQKIINR